MNNTGGINFGFNKDPFKDIIDSMMLDTQPNDKYSFVNIIKLLKGGYFNPPLFVKDPNGTIYEFDFENNSFDGDDGLLSDNWSDTDLVDLELTIIANPKGKDTTMNDILDEQAKDKLRDELEFKYMDLSMELDACQGCTANLEESFAELRVLKEVIEYLGVDINKKGEYERIYNNWYKKRRVDSDK